MTFALTLTQAQKLNDFLLAADSANQNGEVGAYAKAYQFLFALISKDSSGSPIYTDADMANINVNDWVSPDTAGWEKQHSTIDSASWVFIRGVHEVNANDTSSHFNNFIREYSKV